MFLDPRHRSSWLSALPTRQVAHSSISNRPCWLCHPFQRLASRLQHEAQGDCTGSSPEGAAHGHLHLC